jgi:integrase
MTGSLVEKKGYYHVVANVYDSNGKRKQKWIATGIQAIKGNKRKAENKMREVLTELENSKVDITNDYANMLFSDYILSWLESVRHSVEPNSFEGYEAVINRHIVPYFSQKKIRLRQLTPMHLQDYYNHLLKEGRLDGKGGLTANSVKKQHANISKCLNLAMKQNIIPYNPAYRVELPKINRYVGSFYNPDETQQLLDACKGDVLEPAIILTAFYGLRRSEVLGLKWSAIDYSAKSIRVQHTIVKMQKSRYLAKDRTKNESSLRTMPLIPVVADYLKKLKAQQDENKRLQPNDYVDSEYICVYLNGELFKPDFVSQHFNIFLKKKGLRVIRFHDLRHSAATNLLAAGLSMKEIQEWLGHSDIGTTMNIYAHFDMEMKRNIANKLDSTYKI